MVEGRRYSIGAAIADLYVSAMALGVAAAVYVVATSRPVALWLPFIEFPLVALLVIVYHARFARKVSFMSPGEMIFGRQMTDQGKQWFNPYGASRAALFTGFFIAMILAGNSWDNVADERLYHMYTLSNILVHIGLLAILIAGLTMAGRGNRLGGIGISLYFALLGLTSFLAPPPSEELKAGSLAVGYFMLFMVVVTAAAFWWYANLRRRNESV